MKKSKQPSLRNKKGKRLSNEQLDKVSGGCEEGVYDSRWERCTVGSSVKSKPSLK
ncbi:hypothetical protein [Legionella clemsonensis]|uniref:Uncharacterized protein n=1 Tax=Legionella clemsonensis TaxID=1867846 RepID=A0A222NZI6_9GAMM|nr:hypothetical protein [Legionella clemsonensis]ASQ45002.1 hypothetical protein clem_02195 [Legionella clemsonensis]